MFVFDFLESFFLNDFMFYFRWKCLVQWEGEGDGENKRIKEEI